VDDSRLRILTVFKDTGSNGAVVRLQASAYEGELQRLPLWTAFGIYSICRENILGHIRLMNVFLSPPEIPRGLDNQGGGGLGLPPGSPVVRVCRRTRMLAHGDAREQERLFRDPFHNIPL